MKLLDKIKNTFFEEEYVEVKEEKPNKKEKEKVIEKEEIKEEVPKVQYEYNEKNDNNVNNSIDEIKERTKLSYFEDDDFFETPIEVKEEKIEEEPEIKEDKKIYGEDPVELYSSLKLDGVYEKDTGYGWKDVKPKFQPTPVISPIYGILDKNYKKEEVIDKKDKPKSYVSRKDVDLDSIRKKAYGNYSMSEDNYNNTKNEKIEDNIMEDMMEEKTPVADTVTMQDAIEYYNDLGLEYNVDYKDANYEAKTGRRSTKTHDDVIINDNNNNKEENTKDLDKLEDNLFDIVDSIYDEDGE